MAGVEESVRTGGRTPEHRLNAGGNCCCGWELRQGAFVWSPVLGDLGLCVDAALDPLRVRLTLDSRGRSAE